MQSLLFRKYALVSDPEAALVRARAGAAYLDRKLGPGWDRVIDAGVLDIASPFNCAASRPQWTSLGPASRTTTWKRKSAGAAWASSTRPGSSASTASSPSR